MTLPITISEAERNFPKLSTKQNKFRPTMLKKKELSFYSLYRKWHYKIVVIKQEDKGVCSQKAGKKVL